MFSVICAWINDWVNTREADDLRRYRAQYDVIVMIYDARYINHQRITVSGSVKKYSRIHFFVSILLVAANYDTNTLYWYHSIDLTTPREICTQFALCSVWMWLVSNWCVHYNDVIMGAVASQITSITIFYSTVDSDADQRKHQSSASLSFISSSHVIH